MKNTDMSEQNVQGKQEEVYLSKKPKKRVFKLSSCLLCKKSFSQSRNGLKLFCSTQHKRKFRRDKIANRQDLTCPTCKVRFTPKRTNAKFCSKACASLNADNIRYKNDPNYRLAKIIRARLYYAIHDPRYKKGSIKHLGCTIEQLRSYLESKFEPWMNWDNYGAYSSKIKTWQIDHKKPLDSFDLTKTNHLKKACHYSNLQPLEAIKNILKSNKRS